jgi:hypothetical protein
MALRVLVSGSTPSPDDGFVTACQQLGRAFARAGFIVLVGSYDANTADRYVIDGIGDVAGHHSVHVYRPGGTPSDDFQEQVVRLKGRIDFTFRPMQGPWAAVRVPPIKDADAVVVIRGGRGASQVGYVAPVLQVPVLAIPFFGGAGEELWSTFEPTYRQLGRSVSDRIGNLTAYWDESHAELVVSAVEELVRRRVFKSTDYRPRLALFLSLVALLALWIALVVHPILPTLTFFALLFIAALLGVGLRTVLSLLEDPTKPLSGRQLLAEASAALVLAFALSLVYLGGGLTVTGKLDFFESLNQPTDFTRVAVVMTLLGLSAGLLIEKAADRIIGTLGAILSDGGQPSHHD